MNMNKKIQAYVRPKYGFQPQSCWIAHVKELCGLEVKMAHNRQSPEKRKKPCPPDKQEAIKEAFKHFGMID